MSNLEFKNDTRKFKLFSDCVLNRGLIRSLIIDLGRGAYYQVPNALIDILEKYNEHSFQQVYIEYDEHNHQILNEYFNFLDKNELIFTTADPSPFKKIDFLDWKIAPVIYQAIIDINPNTTFKLNKILESLENLSCKFLQLRFYSDVSLTKVLEALSMTNQTSLVGVEVYMKYQSQNQVKELRKFLTTARRVNNVVLYKAPQNKRISSFAKSGDYDFSFVKQDIIDSKNCGIVSSSYFVVNMKHYTKSNNCNSCLHGKISVDVNGDIKNCPSFNKSFGNIDNVTIEAVIEKKSYKEVTLIRKDQVQVCKECEFRNICTDCRAYIENPKDIYSKPLKCGYNPKTGLWEEWSNNPLKTAAIEYYKMISIIKK